MPPKFNPKAGSFTPKKMSIDEYLAQKSPQASVPSSANSTRPGTPLNGSTTSLTAALEKLSTTPITPYLVDIHCAKTIAEVRTHANLLADSVSDPRNLIEWDFLPALKALSKPKNSAIIREAALIIISVLTTKFQQPNEAYFVSFLPIVFDAAADKEPSVRREGTHAYSSIYRMFPVESLAPFVLPELLKYLKSSAKWVSKISCLKAVEKIIDDSPNDLIEMQFVDAIPVLTDASTDFKPELAKAGKKTLSKFVQVLDNLDLSPRFDIIVDTLGDPKKVPDAIKSFSSVTFVAEVTEPALALLVPILDKSLKLSSSSQEQLRQTVIVTENLTRLVNNKREIEAFIPVLLPGVKRVVETASLPEVRELAAKALAVLEEAEAEHSDGKFHGRVHQEEMKQYIKATEAIVFTYLCVLLSALANVNDWRRMKEYFSLVTDNSDEIVHSLRTLFNPATEAADEDGEEEIVNSDFSLAYGSRMLLNKTTLRLLKGHRYGLCGRNGAGKSTLMRSIANGQLEGFPDKSELRTCFVEHKIQESEAELDLVSFIHGDQDLDATRDEVAEALETVGFDSERRAQNVGSLSGGWKMKLELARAMLMKADVLLLDEPTNHLDVTNVKWLISYLLEHTNITSLIVSHDSGFLDAVCTDVIHYENKKLAYYKGNLSEFVKQKPECKSYYTLSDSVVKMAFPPPGILTGVKSNTRSVAKMTDVTFGYPGAEKPSLSHVTCSLSLNSRVAILGPNGAGKSTLIKLLTGELVPWEGKVEKHPNLRIGYIAQHALAHVEQHKEKTANQYLQWRYRFGEDREVLLKESRKISDEEKQIMEKEIDIDDGRGARQLEAVVGRQKLKKSFQYEIKWKFWLPKYNSWVSRERLIDEGFEKLVQKFDDHESSREGLGYRELTPKVISKHFADVGLDSDIADHTPMGSLSGGQLVKVVIAGAMWNNPHLLVLDEPTNYLDRDSLGGLAVAIKEWAGGVVMISHNSEFVSALCPEQWVVENGVMKSNNEAEQDDSPANIKVKTRKKKMTRNDKKLRDERRRLRHINWLSSPKGTPKPVDTSDEE